MILEDKSSAFRRLVVFMKNGSFRKRLSTFAHARIFGQVLIEIEQQEKIARST